MQTWTKTHPFQCTKSITDSSTSSMQSPFRFTSFLLNLPPNWKWGSTNPGQNLSSNHFQQERIKHKIYQVIWSCGIRWFRLIQAMQHSSWCSNGSGGLSGISNLVRVSWYSTEQKRTTFAVYSWAAAPCPKYLPLLTKGCSHAPQLQCSTPTSFVEIARMALTRRRLRSAHFKRETRAETWLLAFTFQQLPALESTPVEYGWVPTSGLRYQ